MFINVAHQVRQASIDAIIIRADGTRENLGTIAYYHRNPLMRLLWVCKEKIKGGYKWLRY